MTAPPFTPSSIVSAVWLSCTWPPVRRKRSGRPSASASRWILVVNPPRERPRASSSAPPFGATLTGGGLLVGSDESGVEHQVLVIRIAGEFRKNPLPDARLLPNA